MRIDLSQLTALDKKAKNLPDLVLQHINWIETNKANIGPHKYAVMKVVAEYISKDKFTGKDATRDTRESRYILVNNIFQLLKKSDVAFLNGVTELINQENKEHTGPRNNLDTNTTPTHLLFGFNTCTLHHLVTPVILEQKKQLIYYIALALIVQFSIFLPVINKVTANQPRIPSSISTVLSTCYTEACTQLFKKAPKKLEKLDQLAHRINNNKETQNTRPATVAFPAQKQ